ncbi:lactonase family protein [Streptomyces sp. NPDC001833]|uniref:lactonase family protein n=1 Tax=Streptomyces sp. NPDC001833 TaxID=3154658 RepID=UPI0033273DF1
MRIHPRGAGRRTVLGAALASVPLLAASVPAQADDATDLVYIGTWGLGQVYAARFDAGRGILTSLGPVAQVSSNWVTAHPSRPVLYVAGGEQGGYIRTFGIDRTSGNLTLLGQLATEPVPAGSGGLSYLGVDRPSDTLLVADFAAGTATTVPVGRDGRPGTPVSQVQDTGSGPSPRQLGPRPHHMVVGPGGRFALVTDFGADRVFGYGFDRRTRTLTVAPRASYTTTAGSGPRRLAFHPDGGTAYLLNELTAAIETLAWNATTGELTNRQSLSTNAPGHTGTTSAAELVLSRDGRFAYVSNRGDNTLVVYSSHPETRLLTEVQRIPCGGTTPWSFALHRSGRWLFVANEASGTVDLFAVDPRSGRLTGTGTSLPVPAPDCIAFSYR